MTHGPQPISLLYVTTMLELVFFCFQSGRIKVQAEISEFKDKLELAKETIAKFKSEISKVQREGLVTSEPNAQTNHHSPSIGGVFGSS